MQFKVEFFGLARRVTNAKEVQVEVKQEAIGNLSIEGFTEKVWEAQPINHFTFATYNNEDIPADTPFFWL